MGIIACSKVATKRFIPALIKANNAKLYMVGSRNLLKAKKTANLFQCNNFGNYEDVIKNTNVDIIYISVPNTRRENIFKLAVKNKKHIFCENPAFINTKQALKYIKLFCS